MTIMFIVILSVICAVLYRLGGASPEDRKKEFPWLPFKPWKSRDVWGSAVALIAAYLAGVTGPWWAWALSFGLMWGATSTYWDEVLGHDNFFAHGFMIGLAMIPLAFFNAPLPLGVRAILLSLLMGVWSLVHGEAQWEEMGRGFFIPLTYGILII